MEQKISNDLIALVHHVELHKSGWWQNFARQMIVSFCYENRRPLSPIEIFNGIKGKYGVSFESSMVDRQCSALMTDGTLVKSIGYEKGKIQISVTQISRLDATIAELLNVDENAKRYFLKCSKDRGYSGDAGKLWVDFCRNFLDPLIAYYAANGYLLVTGSVNASSNRDVLTRFLENYKNGDSDLIQEIAVSFIDPRVSSVRDFILRRVKANFLLSAARIPIKVIEEHERNKKKRPLINVFLDTNFLFSVLGLHDNPSDMAAFGLLELISALDGRVDLRLYVIQDTVEEFQRVMHSAVSYIKGISIPGNVASAASNRSITSVVARYLEYKKRTHDNLKPEEYFSPYIDNTIA